MGKSPEQMATGGEGMRPVLKSVLARCHDSCPNLGRAVMASMPNP
jgi:hypothetical protein